MKRMTRQRAAILRCLATTKRPLSVEEVLALSEKEIPEINLSTIYRNLKTLQNEQKITCIDVPGGSAHYELTSSKHHHYFLCDACSKLFTIAGCPQGLLALVPEGFEMHGHSITLNGFCLECSSTALD